MALKKVLYIGHFPSIYRKDALSLYKITIVAQRHYAHCLQT
jgi:hypothetical protein